MTKKITIPRSLIDITHGESFVLRSMPRFGPMHASQVLRQAANRSSHLIASARLDHSHDAVIHAEFERLRSGLSLDRFLADPILAKRLWKACVSKGLQSAPYLINLRLFAMRKVRRDAFKGTEKPARAQHLIEHYGPAVEAAMRFVKFRFGASIDDMLAHPVIGEAFAKVAATIIPGGTDIDYRLCALQIRKGRHLTGLYAGIAKGLDVESIESCWMNLGTLDGAQRREVSDRGGILELSSLKKPVYFLRTGALNESIQQTFRPEQIRKLLDVDNFVDLNYKTLRLRAVKKSDLPGGTPKAWELKLIDVYNPLLNWPVHQNEAA